MRRLLFLVLILISPLFAWPAGAQYKINVAVAANFINRFLEIASLFEKKTVIHIEATYSSTGQLYTPIINGAPYDLFLSAVRGNPDFELVTTHSLCFEKPNDTSVVIRFSGSSSLRDRHFKLDC